MENMTAMFTQRLVIYKLLLMKKRSSQRSSLLWLTRATYVIAALIGLLGNVISEEVKAIFARAGISGKYSLLAFVGLLIFGLVVEAWNFKTKKSAGNDPICDDAIPESERATYEFLADLATRYQTRKSNKLDGRYEISLVVSDDIEGTFLRHFDEEFDDNTDAGEAAQYIIDRFESRGRLLIVGNPGSGKTVLLLTLAQYLVEKVREDRNQPLPVIFNLDSWSLDYVSFNDWAKAILTRGYGLSPEFAGQLLSGRRIVFLLDGLDELARNEQTQRAVQIRAKCMAALNNFLYDGTMNVIICCRREEFERLRRTATELPVAAVVAVQDLNSIQIDRALVRASSKPRDKFAALHLLGALGQDRNGVLEQVLSTPFYFTTALQVFDSTKAPIIDTSDKKILEANLIAAFVEKKLNVSQNINSFTTSQTLASLTWLASFLNRKERVTFELSDLQPSALSQTWQYRSVFCMMGVIGGIAVGALQGFVQAVLFGMFCSIICHYLITEDSVQWTLAPLRRNSTWSHLAKAGIVIGFVVKLVQLLVEGVSSVFNEKPVEREGDLFGPVVLMVLGVGALILLLIRVVFVAFGGAPLRNIVTEDFARWTLIPLSHRQTWLDILKRGFATSVVGASIGVWCVVLGGSVAVLKGEISLAILLVVIVFGGFAGAVFGLIFGALLSVLKACRRVVRFASIHFPYQRLKAGIAFNLLQWFIMGMMFNYLVLLFTVLLSSEATNVFSVPRINPILIFGILGLLSTPLLQHAILRVCLTFDGAMPLRYAAFLSYATELRILERDGGQWRFRHQILQEYFADRAQVSGNAL